MINTGGKTIMTGLLLKELLMQKNRERVLIVTPGGLTNNGRKMKWELNLISHFKLVNRDVFSSEPTVFQTRIAL